MPAHVLTLSTLIVFQKFFWLLIGHDDVIKWTHFPLYWPVVRGIHRWPVASPHTGQWSRALMFTSICAWTNGLANNRDAGFFRRHRANYDTTVMSNLFSLTRQSLVDSSQRNNIVNFVVIVSLNKLLNKQSIYRLFPTSERPCDVTAMIFWELLLWCWDRDILETRGRFNIGIGFLS